MISCGSSCFKTAVAAQEQRGRFWLADALSLLNPETVHYNVSGLHAFGDEAKKTTIELRVYHVKSGLIGRSSFVHGVIVQFSSGWGNKSSVSDSQAFCLKVSVSPNFPQN